MATSVPVIDGAFAGRTPNSANVRRVAAAATGAGSRIANAMRGMVARAWGGGGKAVTTTRPRNQYMRDGSAGYLSSWNPALRDMPDEVRAVWTRAAARSIDALHNSGWLSGGIDQASADTIGNGLRLNATPDIDVLGWTDEYRAEWSSRVERRFRAWGNDPLECDARGRRTIAELTDAAIRQHFAFGEATALLPQIIRSVSRTKTKVLMVSPHRLSQETNEQARLAQGVFIDGNGLPISYRFRRRINGMELDLDIMARSADGRPQVIHVFDGTPDQVRGISPLAPILKVVRQHDQLTDATLTSALIQTIVTATVTSPELSDEVFEGLADSKEGELPEEIEGYLSAKADWWSGRSLDLGIHGKVAHLFPGEKYDIKSPATPGDNYLPFVRNLLREIARCIGVTYESLTGDYEGATYSSVRMATAAIWAITMRRRQRIAVPFLNPIYRTWLDEEIRSGAIEFPGGYEAFKRNRVAATQCEWQGPAKPTADDLKTAKASTERLSSCVTSLTHECAEIGLDIETVMRDRAREKHLAEKLGLGDPHAARQPTGAFADNPDGTLKEAA